MLAISSTNSFSHSSPTLLCHDIRDRVVRNKGPRGGGDLESHEVLECPQRSDGEGPRRSAAGGFRGPRRVCHCGDRRGPSILLRRGPFFDTSWRVIAISIPNG